MKYYEVAAKWWADKLRNVGPRNFYNGDKGSAGGFLMIMATMNALRKSSGSEEIDAFEKRLAEVIKENVEKRGGLYLYVDYGPDPLLGSVAKETGTNVSALPWKTTMEIKECLVKVSSGYGASWENLL